jgi:integrase
MALNKLTDAAFRKVRPSDAEQLLSDGGGLFVRVRSENDGGAISFRLAYRIEGKQRWVTLGSYPVMSLAEARVRRDECKALAKTGIDPGLEKKNEVNRNRQAQLEEQARHQRLAARATVRDLFDRWVSLELAKRKESSRKELVRSFEKDVLPIIGQVPAEDVTKAHVMKVLDNILARGAHRLANRTLSEMRQLFGFGYTRDIVTADPTHRIRKADVGGKETERDRVLSEDEIRELARRMHGAKLYRPSEVAIWIMLSTGCRVGDLMKARWEEIDLDAGTWTFQPEKDKVHIKRMHTVFLSDFALAQFVRLREVTGSSPWLYPDKSQTKPVCKKSITKQIGDRQRTEALRNRSKLTGSLLLPGGTWTPHDLRRTCTTLMVELGVLPEVAHLCTYHLEQDRIKRTYNRSKQQAAQAEAWRVLGDRLTLLTRDDVDNVVTLVRRAS